MARPEEAKYRFTPFGSFCDFISYAKAWCCDLGHHSSCVLKPVDISVMDLPVTKCLAFIGQARRSYMLGKNSTVPSEFFDDIRVQRLVIAPTSDGSGEINFSVGCHNEILNFKLVRD